MNTINNKHLLLLAIILILVSCTNNKQSSENYEKLPGTYVYQYPTEEIEVLKINTDSTYYKQIYSNRSDFDLRNQPKHSNSGKWVFTKKNKLNFSNWLEYCYLRFPDSILSEPNISFMSNVYWEEPNKKHSGLITVYDDTGYIFENILDWKK